MRSDEVVVQTLALLDLPTEIRLQIYSHLFSGQTVKANANHYPRSNDAAGLDYISLQPRTRLLDVLLVCRTIQAEAITSFYSLLRFCFQRHSMDEGNWSVDEIKAVFPQFRPLDSMPMAVRWASTRDLVRHIYYEGNDSNFIRSVGDHFPSLRSLSFNLDYDHWNSDQMNFDKAMRYAIRDREWRHAIKDALNSRFPDGMVHAVFDLQKTSRAQRNFKVTLHWKLGYRFIEFRGECDLDEWILRVHDPDGVSKNVYAIPQDPLFFEMA